MTLFGKLLCRLGRHKLLVHDWPLGKHQHPTAVCECERCGIVQQHAQWATYEAFQQAHGREECELTHKDLRDCRYCPDCGEKVNKS